MITECRDLRVYKFNICDLEPRSAAGPICNTNVPTVGIKTFEPLRDLDGDDDDALVSAVADWNTEQIHENDKVPGSRSVRRQAAKLCRANGYQIRNDDWLGV